MGLSLLLAIIGSAIVILGVILFISGKPRKFAIACLIVGLSLILVPYFLIYVLLD